MSTFRVAPGTCHAAGSGGDDSDSGGGWKERIKSALPDVR